MNIYEAENCPKRRADIRKAKGQVSASFVYAFPPDIPIIVPGEIIEQESIDAVLAYREDGARIIGLDGWDISII
ncbi:MAG: hypothetical protein J5829_05700 [Lachnospiraceae bacterium]|nr:hypothetical protein [Lachnospiraceae bacterium]